MNHQITKPLTYIEGHRIIRACMRMPERADVWMTAAFDAYTECVLNWQRQPQDPSKADIVKARHDSRFDELLEVIGSH